MVAPVDRLLGHENIERDKKRVQDRCFFLLYFATCSIDTFGPFSSWPTMEDLLDVRKSKQKSSVMQSQPVPDADDRVLEVDDIVPEASASEDQYPA